MKNLKLTFSCLLITVLVSPAALAEDRRTNNFPTIAEAIVGVAVVGASANLVDFGKTRAKNVTAWKAELRREKKVLESLINQELAARELYRLQPNYMNHSQASRAASGVFRQSDKVEGIEYKIRNWGPVGKPGQVFGVVGMIAGAGVIGHAAYRTLATEDSPQVKSREWQGKTLPVVSPGKSEGEAELAPAN